MQIIQYTKAINAHLQPVGVITLEVLLEALQDHLAQGDEVVERYVGREFLKAMHAYINAPQIVEEEEEDDTVPQES